MKTIFFIFDMIFFLACFVILYFQSDIITIIKIGIIVYTYFQISKLFLGE